MKCQLNTVHIPVDPSLRSVLPISSIPIEFLPIYLGGFTSDISQSTVDASILASLKATILENVQRSLGDMVTKVVEEKVRERRLQKCNKGIEMRDVRVTMEDVAVFMDPIDLADVARQVGVPIKSAYIGIYPIRIPTLHFNIPNFWLTSDAFCPLKINRYLDSESQESEQSEDTSDAKATSDPSDDSQSDRRLKSVCGTIKVPTTGMQMKLGKMKVDASMGNESLPTIVLTNIINNIPSGNVTVDLKPMCEAVAQLPDKALQEVLTAFFGEEKAKSIMTDLGKVWKGLEDGVNDLYDDTIGKWIPRPWRRLGFSDIQYSIPVPSSTMTLYNGTSSTGPAVEMHFAPVPVLGPKRNMKVQIDPIKIHGFEVQLPTFKIDATFLSAKDMQSFKDMIDEAMPILI